MRKQVERCLSNAQQEVVQAIRAAAAANLPTEGLVEIRDLIRREIELIKAPVVNSPIQAQNAAEIMKVRYNNDGKDIENHCNG